MKKILFLLLLGIYFNNTTISQNRFVIGNSTSNIVLGANQKQPYSSANIYFNTSFNIAFPNDSTDNLYVQDTLILGTDYAVLKLPPNYVGTGQPTRLVLYCHSYGQSVGSNSWSSGSYNLMDTLLNNGYAICDVNGGTTNHNFGGSYFQQSMYNAYLYIKQNYNIYDDVFIIGASMGGNGAITFSNQHSNIVIALGLLSPMLDLYNQAWLNPWHSDVKPDLSLMYSFPDSTEYCDSCVIGYNAIAENMIIDNNTDTLLLFTKPTKIWMCNEDNKLDYNVSLRYYNYRRKANTYCELRTMNCSDHDTYFKGEGFQARELILFFNRFN